MPYNNEYNRKLAREVDFINRQYIANCDNTGQGTQNYRVQISSYRGGGKGSKEYHCHSSDSEDSMDGGAILGLQAGTILGGPKSQSDLPTRKQIVSTSSLGAPLSTNNATIAETNEESTADVEPKPEGNAQVGGAILGVKPYRFGTTPLGKKTSYLSSQVVPASGKMFRAGRYVSVRDLGDDDVNYSKRSRYESSSEDESSSDEEAVNRGKAFLSIEVKGSAKPAKSLSGLRDSSVVKKASQSLDAFYNKMKKEKSDDKDDGPDGSGMDGGKKGFKVKAKAKKPKSRGKSRGGPSGRRGGPTSRSGPSTNAGPTTSTKPRTATSTTSASNKPPKKKSLYAKALEGISVVGKTASQITDLVRLWKQNNPEEAAEYEQEGDYGEPEPDDEEPDEEEEGEDEEEDEEVDEEDVDDIQDDVADQQGATSKSDKALSDISKKVSELGEPKTGPKWLKERDKGASDVKGMEPIDEVLGFQIYSEDPVGDWIKTYSDSFGDFTGKSIGELINQLYKMDMKDSDIQMYLKQSQGAIKANESRGVSSTITSAKVTPHDIGNKNKNTSCMDSYNNVANANETAQRETRPVRQNDTYFGQSGGYFKKSLNATRGQKDQFKMVPKAQMQGSTMSGFGKPANEKKRKAELRKMGKDELKAVASHHNVKCRGKVDGKTRTLKKAELIDAVIKCEYGMKGSGTTLENASEIKQMVDEYQAKNPEGKQTQSAIGGTPAKKAPDGVEMVANGKPANKKLLKPAPKKNKRAEIVRKIMKEKNLSMIEASKYVKANNLY
jgi:hypothetical protein